MHATAMAVSGEAWPAAALPYIVMSLKNLCTAVLMVILRSVLRPSAAGDRVSAVVLVAYQQLSASAALTSLAVVVDRGKRLKLSCQVVSWAFFIGFLQFPMGELLLTASLQYVTATLQSVGLNMIPVLVFALAVACRREPFLFLGARGQAKLWGVLVSVAGATAVIMVSAHGEASEVAGGGGAGFATGVLLVAAAVLALTVSCQLVEIVAVKYSADLTLAAMMNVFGTVQTVIIAAFMERDHLSAWRIRMDGLQLLAIIHGGVVVNGLLYLGHNWCIHKRGPVFASAFSPLAVVFSFLIETLILGGKTQIGSVIGAVLVIGGLYLLLWAKTRDRKDTTTTTSQLSHSTSHPTEDSCVDPLLPK